MRVHEWQLSERIGEARSFVRQLWVNQRYSPFESAHPEFDRVYFFHIRKCGGTSINSAVIKAVTGDSQNLSVLARTRPHVISPKGNPVVGWDIKLINRGAFFYGFSHAKLDDLRLPPRTFTFTMLRDPVARALSYYNMLCDARSKEEPPPPEIREELNYLGENFDDFLDRVPRHHLESQLYMFDRDYRPHIAIGRLSRLNFVGLVGQSENQLFERLMSVFDIHVEYSWRRKSRQDYRPTEQETVALRSRLNAEQDFFQSALELVSNRYGWV